MSNCQITVSYKIITKYTINEPIWEKLNEVISEIVVGRDQRIYKRCDWGLDDTLYRWNDEEYGSSRG